MISEAHTWARWILSQGQLWVGEGGQDEVQEGLSVTEKLKSYHTLTVLKVDTFSSFLLELTSVIYLLQLDK